MSELRNKMILGALTMGDLHSIVRRKGVACYREFSVGRNWLPVAKVRKRDSSLSIWMEDIGKVGDVSIPLDTVVKIQGDLVSLTLDSDHIDISTRPCFSRGTAVEVRIRLDFKPF